MNQKIKDHSPQVENEDFSINSEEDSSGIESMASYGTFSSSSDGYGFEAEIESDEWSFNDLLILALILTSGAILGLVVFGMIYAILLCF